MIAIHLTAKEARLCRDAAKLAREEGTDLRFLDAGEQRLSRAEWFSVQQWLTFAALDWESRRELATRKAQEALSARIEAVIERFDATMPAEERSVEVRERQGALF